MKISLQWLQEFVDLEGLSADEIGKKLTLHTCELEEIIEQKPYFSHVFFGKLEHVKKHPTADNLYVGQFDLGKKGKKQIVFGSVHTLHEGDIVPLALNGAELLSGMHIQDTVIRGEKSQGMVCDNSELGMKNQGLMRFREDTYKGKLLSEVCEAFHDVLFDIDNKSLTHRPDLMGHTGFARELAAIFGRKKDIESPQISFSTKGTPFPVKIETPCCRRACFLKLSNIKVEPSDLTTQIRLENLGTRAISNIVDVTNLVLIGMGQPMHAFDAAKVEGKIIIRQAKKGEKLIALDGNEYELTSEDTVVADEKKALSLAGIMGGEYSSVTENTTEIILESANWDPVAVRKTSARLGIRSESSMRYEKSLDPEQCLFAMKKAVKYIQTFCPHSKISDPLTDIYPQKPQKLTISLDPNQVRLLSGVNITDQNIKKILESIDFEVQAKGKKFDVQVPSFRATKDVSIAEDLIEEVVRLYGFDQIPSALPILSTTPPKENRLRSLEWTTRDFFAGNFFLEVFQYSFVNSEDKFLTQQKNYVDIQNPLSEEQAHLRVTLLSNFLKNIESELRTHRNVNLFEIGKIYQKSAKTLPHEVLHLGVFSASIGGSENEKFFELKKHVTRFLHTLHLTPEFIPSKYVKPYAHPAKSADIVMEKEAIGEIFVLHPSQNNIKKSIIAFAEINMEALLKQIQLIDVQYNKISAFPSVHRDLSVVVDHKVLMGDLEKSMKKASSTLTKVELFDEFYDEKKLGKNLKNLAFHLEFRSHEKTLDDKTIDREFQSIVKKLGQEWKAKLRLEFDQ